MDIFAGCSHLHDGLRQFADEQRTDVRTPNEVDENALVSALKNKIIAGAGIDVYEFEPKIAEGLVDLPNVILSPHVASASVDAHDYMANTAAENIIAYLEGRVPPNAVK